MKNLKLTSIRLSKKTLEEVEELNHGETFISSSDIIRVAIWLGLKLIKLCVLHKLRDMMWKEELGWYHFSLADVLRIAGVEEDECKG